jgi:hypothetical protein
VLQAAAPHVSSHARALPLQRLAHCSQRQSLPCSSAVQGKETYCAVLLHAVCALDINPLKQYHVCVLAKVGRSP